MDYFDGDIPEDNVFDVNAYTFEPVCSTDNMCNVQVLIMITSETIIVTGPNCFH